MKSKTKIFVQKAKKETALTPVIVYRFSYKAYLFTKLE